MNSVLNNDHHQLDHILELTLQTAKAHLRQLDQHPVGTTFSAPKPLALPDTGVGATETLSLFKDRFAAGLSSSPGPRYFGFVTGGATPASIAGDWLTTVYDQNAIGSLESSSPFIELEAIGFLRDLFGLPNAFTGTFVTGAMMSNFVSLAIGRQWLGLQHGVDIAQQGLQAAPPIKIFSGSPHSTIFKALAMLGLGRDSLSLVACLPNREAIDIEALEKALTEWGQPAIVVANAGTVNTVDFDDLQAIASLRQRHPFWLHVDGAFGGFAACSPHYEAYVAGLDAADSITIDAHKYLNVPYDAAMQFTRHLSLQSQVFLNAAAYLDQLPSSSSFVNLTPESSRRLRALPVWCTLMAYGRAGYRAIVEDTSALAQGLAAKIDASPDFNLLAPVRLNGLCFTLTQTNSSQSLTITDIRRYLDLVKQDGRLFLTPTVYQSQPAMRISITNWRTTKADIDIAWNVLVQCHQQLQAK